MAEARRRHVSTRFLLAIAAATLVPAVAALADPSPNAAKRGYGGGTVGIGNALNANWYYDWGRSPNVGERGEFVPMAWNGGFITNPTAYADLVNNTTSRYVLGFNEPERADQANMSVAKAIELWPELMKLKNADGTPRKLVSPAVSDTAAGKAWMASFISEINRLNYRVDAIAFHWYGDVRSSNAAANFLGSVAYYNNTYTVDGQKLPIWITEFGGLDFSGGVNPVTMEMNETFLAQVLPTLDSRSYVERYAWWNWSAESSLGTGTPFTPSALGKLYNGRSYVAGQYAELDGQEGDDTFYLYGGAIQKSAGAETSIRFINALEGASQIRGSADWNVENGSIRIRSGATIQKQGTNTIAFKGGTVTNDGNLFVKLGTLELAGGVVVDGTGLMKIETGSAISLEGAGSAGVTINNDLQLAAGTLRVNAGSHTLNGDLIVSNSSSFSVTGDFTLNGAITNATFGARNLTKTGAGKWRVNAASNNTGAVTISGGTLETANATGAATGTGLLTIGSASALTGNGLIGGTTTVAGTIAPSKIGSAAAQLRFAAPLTVQSTGKVELDVKSVGGDSIGSTSTIALGGLLALKTTALLSDLAPQTLVSGSSINGIFATVSGVALSFDPSRALAVTYTPTSVLVTQTLGGDLNIDGKVDYDDLVSMVQNDRRVNGSWVTGDVTGDGATGAADLTFLRGNYGRSTSGVAVPANAFDYDYARATGVPEPASVGGLLLASLWLGRRRR